MQGHAQQWHLWLICHQVSADLLETYQLKRFHQGYYNLYVNMGQGGLKWGNEWNKEQDTTHLKKGRFGWV